MHAKRSHTHIHRVRRAAACRAESLTDRPRVCACATPRRSVWSCTFPSHSDLTRMQKGRHRSDKVRPSAAMAHATSLSPAPARVPSERLTVGPRVRLTIAGTRGHAWSAWRAGRLRATALGRLLCASLVACGKVATRDGLVWAVRATRACRGDARARCGSQGRSRRDQLASVCGPRILPQHILGLGRCRGVLLAIHEVVSVMVSSP